MTEWSPIWSVTGRHPTRNHTGILYSPQFRSHRDQYGGNERSQKNPRKYGKGGAWEQSISLTKWKTISRLRIGNL